MASGKSDELKGRMKEAAGALIGDKKLKRKGQTEQAVGKVKQKVARAVDQLKKAGWGESRSETGSGLSGRPRSARCAVPSLAPGPAALVTVPRLHSSPWTLKTNGWPRCQGERARRRSSAPPLRFAQASDDDCV